MPYWILPGGLVLLAVGLCTWWPPASPLLAEATRGYPYLLLVAAAGLAWRFQRSRIAVASLLLCCVQIGATILPAERHPEPMLALATLFPLALGALALADDRGLFSRAGLAQLQVAIVLPALLVGLVAAAPQEAGRVLGPWVAEPWGDGRIPLPRLATFGYLGGAALAGAAAARRRRATEAGLLWLLPASFLLLEAPGGSPGRGAWFLAGAAILVMAVVEASYAMAYHDDLTGLPARRALRRALAALEPPYATAIIDIDHFKRVNDRFGHDVGDQVLRMVAGRIARVKGGGRAYRSGGEEFTVLFPGASREAAREWLEELRREIAAEPFRLRGRSRPARKPAAPQSADGKLLPVTVSIGVAAATPGEHTDRVLEVADEALYKAKRRGRNRVAR